MTAFRQAQRTSLSPAPNRIPVVALRYVQPSLPTAIWGIGRFQFTRRMIGQVSLVGTVAVHRVDFYVVVAISGKDDRLSIRRPMRTKIGCGIAGQSLWIPPICINQVDFPFTVPAVAVRDARAVGRPSRMIFLPFRRTGNIRLITSVRVHNEEIKGPVPIADKRDLRRLHGCALSGDQCDNAERLTSSWPEGAAAACVLR